MVFGRWGKVQKVLQVLLILSRPNRPIFVGAVLSAPMLTQSTLTFDFLGCGLFDRKYWILGSQALNFNLPRLLRSYFIHSASTTNWMGHLRTPRKKTRLRTRLRFATPLNIPFASRIASCSICKIFGHVNCHCHCQPLRSEYRVPCNLQCAKTNEGTKAEMALVCCFLRTN